MSKTIRLIVVPVEDYFFVHTFAIAVRSCCPGWSIPFFISIVFIYCWTYSRPVYIHLAEIPLAGRAQVAQRVRKLDYLTIHTNISLMPRGFVPGFVNYKKGALDLQLQVIKFTSCLPMDGGSLLVLQLLPPLNIFAII